MHNMFEDTIRIPIKLEVIEEYQNAAIEHVASNKEKFNKKNAEK